MSARLAARRKISREPGACVWVRDAPSLLSRALQPSGSLCTFRRCTGGSAQGCHGATAEGFPEFIPSTSRVSARRHLIDESPALTAVLQAQRPAIVAAGIAQERNSDPRPGQPRRENASSRVPWNQEISLAP